MQKIHQIGLVLGGGGARGLAHIGVAKVLIENGITFSHLAGCSMGGIVAASLAFGLSIDEIEKIARQLNSKMEIIKLLDRTPSRKGLLAGKNIRKYLSRFLDPLSVIEDTTIPLVLNAVDLITGKEVALTRGNLIDGIMATTAVPGFFPPVQIGSYRLVDGGVLDDVPVKFMREFSVDFVLAVDVHQQSNKMKDGHGQPTYEHIPLPIPSILQDFYRVEMIMANTLVEHNLREYPPDLLITPSIPNDVTSLFGFTRVNEIIQAGENAMREKMPELLQQLS